MSRWTVLAICSLLLASRPSDAQLLQRGTQKLGFDLASDLEKNSNANFVFSPYSAHSAFSQLLLGSNGQTQEVLENVLGISVGETLDYQSVRDKLTSDASSTLNVANILAVAQGFKPKQSFTSQLITRFQSDVRELDFGNSVAAANELNNVVKSVTNNKITDLLSSSQIDSRTRMILINAIYFKAPWKTMFNRAESFSGTFNTPTGSEEVTFMTARMNVRLLQDSNNRVDILELPYTDPNKAMLVVLPTDQDSSDLVNRVQNIDLNTVRDLNTEEVVVSLPRFKLRKRLNLKEKMQKLGAGDIFDAGKADFSNLSDRELYVTDAVQDAFVEVTEEGTEAAAATAVQIGVRTSKREKQFIADEPFLFIIYDFQTRMPLFFGKVNQPSDAGLASRSSFPGRDAVPSQQPQPSLNIEVVPADPSAAPVPLTGQSPSANCERYLADYPNALENAKLCDNAESLRLFDWLRAARDTCDKSRTLKRQFDADQCGLAWCKKTQDLKAKWEADKVSLCSGTDKPTKCKTLTNHLSAYESLGCDKL